MSETEAKSDEHILIHVVTMFTQQAWMAMGKLKNPMTDKMERNLQEASFFIDILDMMKKRKMVISFLTLWMTHLTGR